jgi:hypothetical protein
MPREMRAVLALSTNRTLRASLKSCCARFRGFCRGAWTGWSDNVSPFAVFAVTAARAFSSADVS